MASSLFKPIIFFLLLSTTLAFSQPHDHGSACSSSPPPSITLPYSSLPLPVLFLLILLVFYCLIHTASHHFSPVVTRLSSLLRLSPSMAAVTLLALGNGAPDLFSSAAALSRGNPRTGLAAILSAGAFVSSFVVGSVAILAAPFPLPPAPFLRDVFFYLLAASALFYVYLTAHLSLSQAIAFVSFYVFFVALVFWMDLRCPPKQQQQESPSSSSSSSSLPTVVMSPQHSNSKDDDILKLSWITSISNLCQLPVTTILKLTIPSISPGDAEHHHRFYKSANILFCPLAILFSFNSAVPFNTPISIARLICAPLWLLVSVPSLCAAASAYYFFLGKRYKSEDAQAEQKAGIATLSIAFMMSVFWISTMAGELLNCLSAVGSKLHLPPGILGLTVLAWGNSVGDLVADVALARAGQPAMAIAGCFVGPMFNMLVGLGSGLLIETAKLYPETYELRFHASIVVAFVFLLLSLMGSLFVVTWYAFRVPRFWGFCLVGLYLVFTVVSLATARYTAR